MDPLSIIASTIAIATATAQTLEALRSIYGASSELHALMNEVSELQIVLPEVERVTLERRTHQQLPQRTIDQICKLLEGAMNNLHSLDNIIKDRLIHSYSPSGEAKVARLAWLHQKSKVRRIQQELRGARNSLSDLWRAAHLSDISHIQLRLDEFAIIHEPQTSQLSEHGKYLKYISNQLTPSQPHEEISNSIEKSVERFSLNTQTGDGASSNSSEISGGSIIERRMSIERYSSPGNGPKTYSAIRVRASHYRKTRCEGWCSCLCHRPRYVKTPQSLDFLLGSLFMGYSGLPAQSQSCNERGCRQQSIPTVKVTYHFPYWLLGRVIQFAVSISSMKGPELILRMYRVVPANAPIINYAVQGNLDGIKSLFSKGLASPFDVIDNGRTALHYAVNNNHRDLTQFLIDTGADPTLEDESHGAIRFAWERIFGGKLAGTATNHTIDAWRCLFDDEEYLESRTFPSIHKTVLGLVKSDLRQQLELSTSTIDDTDADGRTALSWAAAKGDADAVKILLEFGANPHVCSHRSQSPLQWAGQNPSERCAEIMQALVDHNVDVNLIDQWNRIVLINAAGDLNDPECLRVLVDAGSHLNWRDCYRRTAVGVAAGGGKTENVSYLISRGADPRIPDHWGYAPIHQAVEHNYHRLLERLLQEHSIVPIAKTVNGMTILHIAALSSDIETMHLLARCEDIKILDPDECNDEGLSPQNLFDDRENVTPELREAFRALIEASLRNNDAPKTSNVESNHDPNDSGSYGEFTDAVEFQ